MPDTIPEINFTLDPSETIPAPVDPSLSIEGMAADAKATGDALALKLATYGELDPLDAPQGTDEIPVGRSGAEYTIDLATLATALRTIGGALPIADGGTGVNTAASARTALNVMGEEITLQSSPVNINPGTIQVFTSVGFPNYKFIDLYFEAQGGYFAATRLYVGYEDRKYKLGFFAWNDTDSALRRFTLTFTSNGRYIQDAVVKMAYGDNGTFVDASNALHLVKAIGYAW